MTRAAVKPPHRAIGGRMGAQAWVDATTSVMAAPMASPAPPPAAASRTDSVRNCAAMWPRGCWCPAARGRADPAGASRDPGRWWLVSRRNPGELNTRERHAIARLLEASREALQDEHTRPQVAAYLMGMLDQAAIVVRQGYRAHLLDRLTDDLDQRLQQLADAALAPERNAADPFTVEAPHRPIANSGPYGLGRP